MLASDFYFLFYKLRELGVPDFPAQKALTQCTPVKLFNTHT